MSVFLPLLDQPVVRGYLGLAIGVLTKLQVKRPLAQQDKHNLSTAPMGLSIILLNLPAF